MDAAVTAPINLLKFIKFLRSLRLNRTSRTIPKTDGGLIKWRTPNMTVRFWPDSVGQNPRNSLF